MPLHSTIAKTGKSATRLQCYRHPRYQSSKPSGGQKLSPLPSSPAQAKKQYLKSKEAAHRYLDPQKKLLQMNRELEVVRNKHAEKLERELEKSIYRRLVDPLVRNKHSIYNVVAMTIAYVLAHNLYVMSKKEQECRADLLKSKEENFKLKQKISSLRCESTLREIGSACAMEIELEQIECGTSMLPARFSTRKTIENNLLGEIVYAVLRKHLLAHIGEDETVEEEFSKLSTEEIMLQNQQNIKAMNANPKFLIEGALQQSGSNQTTNGEKSRRVFSL